MRQDRNYKFLVQYVKMIILEGARGSVQGGKYHKTNKKMTMRAAANSLGVSYTTVFRALQQIETKHPYVSYDKRTKRRVTVDPGFWIADKDKQIDRENIFADFWNRASDVSEVVKEFGLRDERLARFIARVVELRLGMELKEL